MTLRQLGLAMGLASTLHAQPSEADLRSRLLARLAHAPGATAGIFVKDLGTGREVGVNADTSFHAASTMKVPVMIEYFRGLDAGRWSPDATVVLRNQFASIVDGSPYSLDAAEDSDSALYVKVGQAVSVRELVYRMITRSSNLATNAVIALVGAESADATAHALGARTIHVRRGVEDNLAYQAGLNNTTSARDLGALLAAIAEGTAVSRARSDEMLGMLEHQEFNDEIPAGLPPGTRVAHKTGWIAGTRHDAALVYPDGRTPFVLVVLTRGIQDEGAAKSLISDLARLVWDDVVGSPAR